MSAKPFVFDTDVLIIGGGFSGSWAALTARQHVENVLIVDKGPRDWGGLGGMSGGDMIVKQPEFAAKDLVEELVYYYDGLCEQDVLEEILNQSYERFKDYEKMGHEFARDDSGRLMSIPSAGSNSCAITSTIPTARRRAHHADPQCRASAAQRPAHRAHRDHRSRQGRRRRFGAVGFHAQSGTPCLFRAKAVILAAHNGGWKGSYLLNTCAGEGAALAYGAGASLRNMEFIENWNVPKLFAWEGQTGMLPYGARFLNGEGEDLCAAIPRSSEPRPTRTTTCAAWPLKSGPDAGRSTSIPAL
ncbi:MAG: FAD-binding protein [Bilophila wadsworthia]